MNVWPVKLELWNWMLCWHCETHLSASMYFYLRISASVKPLMFSLGMVRGRPRFFGLLRSETESLSEPEYLRFRLRRPSFPLKLIWKRPSVICQKQTNEQTVKQTNKTANSHSTAPSGDVMCCGIQGSQCAECACFKRSTVFRKIVPGQSRHYFGDIKQPQVLKEVKRTGLTDTAAG